MFAEAVSLLLVISSFVLMVKVWWRRRLRKYQHIPFPPTYPFVGNLHLLPRDPEKLLEAFVQFEKELGSTFIIWVGPIPVVFSSDPEVARPVLNDVKQTSKSMFYDFAKEWLGQGLLISSGDVWRHHRRAVTPLFRFNMLKEFTAMFDMHAQELVKRFHACAYDGRSVEAESMVTSCTLRIVCEAIFGRDGALDEMAETNMDVLTASVQNVLEATQLRQKNPFLWPAAVYKLSASGRKFYDNLAVIKAFTKDMITKSLKVKAANCPHKNTANCKRTFLQLLLQKYNSNELTLQDIEDEINTLIFAGHDTTASAVSWTLFLLGNNSSIQDKVRKDIQIGFQQNEKQDILEATQNMPYLDSVIKESLRLFPPVPCFVRRLQSDVHVENVSIPTGTDFAVPVYTLHRNPRYWEKPGEFLPERFSDSASTLNRHPYQYIPFSAGYRNCIGQKFALMEAKIILSRLLREFTFTSKQSMDEVQCTAEIVLHSKDGIWLDVEETC